MICVRFNSIVATFWNNLTIFIQQLLIHLALKVLGNDNALLFTYFWKHMLANTFLLHNYKQHTLTHLFTVRYQLRAHIRVAQVYNFMNTATGPLAGTKYFKKYCSFTWYFTNYYSWYFINNFSWYFTNYFSWYFTDYFSFSWYFTNYFSWYFTNYFSYYFTKYYCWYKVL